MADYITTYGGTHFMPMEPEAADIHITDIAHALSLIVTLTGILGKLSISALASCMRFHCFAGEMVTLSISFLWDNIV